MALCLWALWTGARAADWSLEIAPTSPANPIRVIHVGSPAPAFDAVLTNTSDHPLVLWKEWCSFGYFNLSFQVTRADGEVFILRRLVGSWYGNFPDPQTVAPGQPFAWPVVLDANWGTFPKNWQDGESVTIRAIYENERDLIEEKLLAQRDEKMEEKLQALKDPAALKAWKESKFVAREHYQEAWTGKVSSQSFEVKLYQLPPPFPH